MTAIVYFRRDLRLHDNAALRAAAAEHVKLAFTFVHNVGEGQWIMGGASKWYLNQSLHSLAQSLADQQHELLLSVGNELTFLVELAKQIGADEIYWNRIYEPAWIERDNLLKATLKQHGITAKVFHDHSLLKPGSILNKAECPYKVFTPYWRVLFSELLSRNSINLAPADLKHTESVGSVAAGSIDDLQLLDGRNWHLKLQLVQKAGEPQALEKLESLYHKLADYPTGRDFPTQDATSNLSAALHFGEISPWRIFERFRPALLNEQGAEQAKGAQALVRQLGWREFAINLLYQHPDSVERSLQSFYDQSEIWGSDKTLIELWQQGKTGCALVDAGMRELWQTGDMHNRVRMVVASYLTKNLGQHWLHGARWFWDTLIDADLANNTMGWQWVAGCGCDAAPFYRIFNPERQTERFDPERAYISRWLHNQSQTLEPLVDLHESRERALARYAFARNR